MQAIRDPQRLAALHRLRLLDTPAEEAFDRLTRLAAFATGAPVSVVSLLDESRQFAKSCVLPPGWPNEPNVPLEDSFCKFAVASRDVLLIEDAREDPRVASSGFVDGAGVLSYAGVPLIASDGQALGTLCVADLRVRRWTAREVSALRDLAAAVVTEIEVRRHALESARAADLLCLEKQSLELLARAAPLSQILDKIVLQVEEIAGGARCAVLLIDEEERRLQVAAAPHLPEAYHRAMEALEIGEGQGGCGTAAHRREAVIVNDARTDPLWLRFRDVAETCGIRASWSFPIVRSEGGVLGVLALYPTTTRAPQPQERELIDRVRYLAAIAIERARSEAARRESEERFRAMFNRASIGVLLVDPDGRVLMANPALRRMLGYTGRELRKKRFADYTHPADAARSIEMFHQAMAGHQDHYRLEKRYVRKDGEEIWAEITVSVVKDSGGTPQYAIAMIANLSEQRRAATERSAAVEHYRRLVETSPLGIYVLNEEGLCTEINPVLADIIGRPVSELLGRHFSEIIAPKDRDRASLSFRQRLSGEKDQTEIELELIRASGEPRLIQVRATAIRMDGVVVGTHGVVQDITEKRLLEDQLMQAQKMEAVGRLAGGVAHDINNVLTAIKGNTQLLLLDLPEGHPMHEEVAEIDAAANRAAALTRQLLAFSRKQVRAPRVANLNDTVRRMTGMLRRLIGEHIHVVTSLEADLGTTRVDPSQMEQVVTNLVVNARDAMPTGGTLRIETRNHRITAEELRAHPFMKEGEYVEVRVQDNGSGISAEVLPSIFEPFFTTKQVGEGTGLGLSTVYGIVKQSDGYVLVETREAEGATFRVLFPRLNMAPETQDDRPPAQVRTGRETVLLAEDEDAVRLVARRTLERHGYTVVEARDGEEALHLLELHGAPFDLLLTDVVMPRMTGPELAARVTARQPGIGVLFMSGYPNGALDEAGSVIHVNVLPKPFSPQLLLERVRDALDRASAR